MLLFRAALCAALVCGSLGPTLALNPQPFPPPGGKVDTLDNGEHFKVEHGQLLLIDARGVATKAPAGSYVLRSGERIEVLSSGKFSEATMRRFPSLGSDTVDLNPQPFPPPKGGAQH